MRSDVYHFEAVATRLQAINATSLQLLVLDTARSDLELPRQTILRAIKEIYSKQDLRGEQETSILTDYCAYLRHYAAKSDTQAAEIYDGLQSAVLPHVLLATIIAEAHIAGDRETFFRQQDWAFERLIGECFSDGYPCPEHLTDDQITELVSSIRDAVDGIRLRIEESRQLKRYADERYMDDNHLREAVIELLARSILCSGQEAIDRYRGDSQHEQQVEAVFSEFFDYLPAEQQRHLKDVI
jgi:hypothetical protein